VGLRHCGSELVDFVACGFEPSRQELGVALESLETACLRRLADEPGSDLVQGGEQPPKPNRLSDLKFQPF
jgi:hypothetical protein